MAMSYQFVNQSNQVRASFFGKVRHGCSSSQTSLAKILRTISTFRPCGTIKQRDLDAEFGENLCCDLCVIVGDGVLSVCSAVVGGVEDVTLKSVVEISSEGECEFNSEEGEESYGHEYTDTEAKGTELEERTIEVSEITNLEVQRGCEITGEGEDKKIILEKGGRLETKSFWRKDDRSEGYIGLLIEAAKLISSDFGENKKNEPEAEVEEESTTEKKPCRNSVAVSHALGGGTCKLTRGPTRTESTKRCRDQYWTVDLYGGTDDLEMSPRVVRSKRGRSQVLPHRFRDSVLEPWKPLWRPRPNPVLTRRRSRR